MTLPIPHDVGWTALAVAAQRAAESRRPDALFHDPVAEALTDLVGEGAHGTGEDATPPLRTDGDGAPTAMTRLMGDYLPVRTRFFDACLLAAVADGVDQVVILAAGLDGRAFRLDWPAGTRVFEVDVPDVHEFKDRVIESLDPTTDRRTVAVDLRDDWPAALTAAGFDPDRPAAWLAEGLLIYLPAGANDLLLDRIGTLSAPGSRLALEYTDGDPADAQEESMPAELAGDPAMALFRDLVDEGPDTPPHAWLPARGWTATVSTLPEVARELGRRAPEAMDETRGGMRAWLVDARR